MASDPFWNPPPSNRHSSSPPLPCSEAYSSFNKPSSDTALRHSLASSPLGRPRNSSSVPSTLHLPSGSYEQAPHGPVSLLHHHHCLGRRVERALASSPEP